MRLTPPQRASSPPLVEKTDDAARWLADALGTGPGCHHCRGDLFVPGWTAFRASIPAANRRCHNP